MKGTIYRRKNSRCYYADYTLANGKRRRVSTGEETKEKAELFLAKLKEVDHFTRQKRDVRRRALRCVGEIMELNTGAPLKDYTVGQWMEEWLAEKKRTRASSTGERYGQSVRDFLAHIASRADDPLEMLPSSSLTSFWDAERATGKSKETVRVAINIVRSALLAAQEKGLVEVSPGSDFEEEAVTPEAAEAEAFGRGEKGLFTAEEAAAVLEVAEGDWKNMIRLAYYAGLRLGDCLGLRWRHVGVRILSAPPLGRFIGVHRILSKRTPREDAGGREKQDGAALRAGGPWRGVLCGRGRGVPRVLPAPWWGAHRGAAGLAGLHRLALPAGGAERVEDFDARSSLSPESISLQFASAHTSKVLA